MLPRLSAVQPLTPHCSPAANCLSALQPPTALCWVASSTASLLRCLVLTAPVRGSTPTSAVRLSAVQPPTVLCWVASTASLLSSHQLPSAGSRRQLQFASPYHFRIRRDFMSKNPLSGFAPKQTRLPWRPTHIVLHGNLELQ